MSEEVQIRRGEMRDVPGLLRIYNHYVLNTAVTFDIEARTIHQRRAWFESFSSSGRHQCFVVCRDDNPIGWASSGPFKEKDGYETSVETSVYLAPEEKGKGLGRRLYDTLLSALQGAGVHRAYGGIAQPNAASIRLHRAVGFTHAGTFCEVGLKFGRFWDVAWYQRSLAWP